MKETITLAGEEYGLLFNLAAIDKLKKKYGSMTAMGARFTDKALDQFDLMEDVVFLVTLLVNQWILTHNFEVKRGIIQGKDLACFSESDVQLLLRPKQIPGLKNLLFNTISSQSEIEEDDDGSEEDVVLQEIQQQKNG